VFVEIVKVDQVGVYSCIFLLEYKFCNDVVNEMLKIMLIKKTTTSPYHPQTNAQVEVCNKTITTYLKTQVDTTTLDWELYMAPMTFPYNTSFHKVINKLH
jgi:hypothetical protein